MKSLKRATQTMKPPKKSLRMLARTVVHTTFFISALLFAQFFFSALAHAHVSRVHTHVRLLHGDHIMWAHTTCMQDTCARLSSEKKSL